MYLDFYGLSEKPFSQTPDPRFLYWNDGNREALANLTYGVRERKGFLTMIGEAGTGKTTLLRKLLDDLGSEVLSVFLFNPNATFDEILEYTLSELGIPVPSGRKLAMLQRLNEFLLAAFAEGRNTILLIDEAQDLDADVLESLRLLSNLETSQEKILQIVLSGQPELAIRLAEPGLRQLKQRIAVRCRLEPLRREELAEYIGARLAVSGGRPDLFTPETLDPIWSFAQGIPRLINMVCDNALLVGYALGRRTIDRAIIDEVVADLRRIDVDFGAPASSSPASPAVDVGAGSPASASLATSDPEAGNPAGSSPAVSAATVAPDGPLNPSLRSASSAAGSKSQETSRSRASTTETVAPASGPEVRASPFRRPVVLPRDPEAESPRERPARGWVGAAAAGIALLALGGALTLWADRSLRADPVRGGNEVVGDAKNPVRPQNDAPPRGEIPAKEPGEDAAAVVEVPDPRGASLAESPPAIPPNADEPAPEPAGPEPAPRQELAEPDRGERRAPQLAHAMANVDPQEPTADPKPGGATSEAARGREDSPEPGVREEEPLAKASVAGPEIPGEPPGRGLEQEKEPDAGARGSKSSGGAEAPTVAALPDIAAAAQEPKGSAEATAPAVAAVPDLAAEETPSGGVVNAASAGRGSAAQADAAKLVQVRSGDTLSSLATRAYGRANLTTLDMLRSRNPGIGDIDLILQGERIEFPDPGPAARLLPSEGGLAVLALTTPELVDALAMQEALEHRYALPVDLKPMELGRRRDLYRVSILAPGEQKALEIASKLGSILEDPGT